VDWAVEAIINGSRALPLGARVAGLHVDRGGDIRLHCHGMRCLYCCKCGGGAQRLISMQRESNDELRKNPLSALFLMRWPNRHGCLSTPRRLKKRKQMFGSISRFCNFVPFRATGCAAETPMPSGEKTLYFFAKINTTDVEPI
jgi:hypothetical protein